MYTPSTNWMEQIKNVIEQKMQNHTFVLQGYVTSVNPTAPYSVKVMLEPYETETGWLPVQTLYATNNGGLLMPPPDEGTPVTVVFDMADISQGKVIAMQWNNNVTPPNESTGTMGLFHKSGSYMSLAPDGSVNLLNSGGFGITVSKDGLVTIKGKNSTQSW